jgi:RNA polymerase sigma-32 factor
MPGDFQGGHEHCTRPNEETLVMAVLSTSHSLRLYRSSLHDFEPLPREEERALTRRWRAGEKRAGERIVEACLPFVISIALEYRRWSVPLEDIIQQGNIGLLRAAEKFDPERDVRLATYAAYWIRAEIREFVVRAYRVVRLGTTKNERRALRAYRTTRESDPEKLAAMSGLQPERVAMLLPVLAGREASLELSADGQGSVGDRLASDGPDPEEETAESEQRSRAKNAVRLALDTLSERERLIARERLMSEDPLTLQALGEMLGVSKERVRQLEERTRTKLRGCLGTFAPAV